jgi:hypothetical protein
VGFYIRKSVKAGPFRFNLSKSGLGVSAGVPGFRVGTGPRGNYVHAGRDGFYYRSTLGGSRRTRRPTRPAALPHPQQAPHPQQTPHTPHAPAYRPNDVILEDATGATAMSLEPTGGDDVVAQLNAVATRMRWVWPVSIASVVFGLVYTPYSLILWVLLAPLCYWVFLHDQASRTVVLFYDVNDAPASWFDSLVTQWDWLTGSQKIWRVVRSGRVATTYQYKTHSGASSLVSRVTAVANTSGPKHLSTNVAIPSLAAGNSSLYFLPDRVLLRDGNRYSDISYHHFHVAGTHQRFIEDAGPIPGDADRVDQTWRYVNVKGGPDHRYKDNPVLPIMLYGQLDLTSPQGLSWELQISRADAAPAIAKVMSEVPAVGHK